jgi:hypothetical protein
MCPSRALGINQKAIDDLLGKQVGSFLDIIREGHGVCRSRRLILQRREVRRSDLAKVLLERLERKIDQRRDRRGFARVEDVCRRVQALQQHRRPSRALTAVKDYPIFQMLTLHASWKEASSHWHD